MTHLLAFHADVCSASIVLSPSTDNATATRSADELRSRTSYSAPRGASTYGRPWLRYSVNGRPSTSTSSSNVGYGIRLVTRCAEEFCAGASVMVIVKSSIATAGVCKIRLMIFVPPENSSQTRNGEIGPSCVGLTFRLSKSRDDATMARATPG